MLSGVGSNNIKTLTVRKRTFGIKRYKKKSRQ